MWDAHSSTMSADISEIMKISLNIDFSNATNINKTNNHFLLNTHKKTTTYDVNVCKKVCVLSSTCIYET
jgi:hypothetical protein